VYIAEKCAHATEKSRKLKCNGSTLGPMKLHGRWWITFGQCILPCFPFEEKQLQYGGLVCALIWWFGIFFDKDFGIFLIWCFGICFEMVFYYILRYGYWYMF